MGKAWDEEFASVWRLRPRAILGMGAAPSVAAGPWAAARRETNHEGKNRFRLTSTGNIYGAARSREGPWRQWPVRRWSSRGAGGGCLAGRPLMVGEGSAGDGRRAEGSLAAGAWPDCVGRREARRRSAGGAMHAASFRADRAACVGRAVPCSRLEQENEREKNELVRW
jgi:hypothetical protein